MVYLIGIIFLTIFAAINLTVGLRGWIIIRQLLPFINVYLYWILFAFIALSFFLGRLGGKFLPSTVDAAFNIVGGYWIAALYYFIILAVLLAIVKVLIKLASSGVLFRGYNVELILNMSIFIVIFIILAYGTYNATHSKIIKYDIAIDKRAGDLKNLNIVTVSDIHLGSIVGKSRLNKMIVEINGLKPDIVFLCGDIVDDDISPFLTENMGETFKQIKSKYGVYAVLGNHEYIGGNIQEIEKAYKEANIILLKDGVEKVNNSFYVVGRDDVSGVRVNGKKREDISKLIERCDKTLPIIVLDHQPVKIEEAKSAGVDLQFSGHTHKGQFFPTNLITKKIFKIDYGYLKEDKFNIIVTSGFGTWGPPIRVGSNSEIVKTEVDFK
ncbi:metallophosphoesterase [Clostridiaceae bacterium UIB06]|uniref:Metallophosphoesterase n=1 Tax=Clostridium thailandense TaxID=2794346 RepID=A0A949TM63_9CLOT|nr:metallophosphoesterase [Clostridium thailandense]MBV7273002.1 metallophosphoesterase [Clostridium thailandense]MCH5135666.1 metallophosphoesterase [Clostridiaceae bacterium UIB06]